MKRKFCCCGCLLVLLAIIGGVAFYFYSTTRVPTVGEDFSKLTPQVKKQRRAESEKLQHQVRDITRAAREKKHKPFTLVITESQLNTLLQDNIRIEKSPVSQLRAGLSPEEITLQSKIDYKGYNFVATASGTIVVENNKIRCDVDSLNLGGIPAPSSVREKVSAPVTKLLNEQLVKAPGRISRITLGDKKLTIEGVTD